MPDLLLYLLKQGIKTQKDLFPELDQFAQVVAGVTQNAECPDSDCNKVIEICPTGAISVLQEEAGARVALDQGACIGCGLCISSFPNLFHRDNTSRTARTERGALIQTNRSAKSPVTELGRGKPFSKSFAIRVVSTGCSACDLEVSACGNPIFDMERFGVQIVASPRAADGLLVTGPVPKAMHEPLLRTYEAMPEPRIVIAAGTCAISGGVHQGGYSEANGVASILPVDVFIPGCPPHPWNLIHGISLAMGKLP
jgi:formate hydrogenlyase subunit 7